MSLETVWDAVARLAGDVEGVKGAHGRQATDHARAWPDDITDGPVALVDWAGSELLGSAPFERWGHDFDVTLWVPLGNNARGAGVQLLAPLFERFIAAVRVNAGLYGALTDPGFAQVIGASGIEEQSLPSVSDKRYLVLVVFIRAQEARSVTSSIGPPS
jgi:hypothetical protein